MCELIMNAVYAIGPRSGEVHSRQGDNGDEH